MTKTTTTKRPTHTVFVVEGEGDKTTWTEIGALWSHDDRKGFNLNLKALPLSGRLVIRERKAKESVGA
ncbi:hypothetical protein AB0V79_27065 [Mesorhizobium ciceri]|uniref:hypothetical protein n=1 Tax=Mesorhizobium ciceri TaxID=39645 RepID=UPI0007A9508F|nr:hypothetical protein [Mesorhizobium ciceri]AMY00717.1 hypothetical protein A4R29_15350 [Mesorhizobium ciceri biovar biserrulae]